jgi:hypothetical protein
MISRMSLVIAAPLAACAATPHAGRAGAAGVAGAADAHVPRFARRSFEPFSRDEVVAIALREWRLFDRPVDDDPPNTRPPLPADLKPERMPGLWERVGEYWWLGINADEYESNWTGKHDENGWEFPASQDASYAWSATFVSYVMRIAGAGPRFPYSISHSDYINTAKETALDRSTGYAITAERLNTYAPQAGDLICLGRGLAGLLTYDDLPAGRFPAHCDIVVRAQPGELSVIGGNVDDAVTMKHVPVTADGKLATPDGTVLDTRYPWLAVIRVLYDVPPVS